MYERSLRRSAWKRLPTHPAGTCAWAGGAPAHSTPESAAKTTNVRRPMPASLPEFFLERDAIRTASGCFPLVFERFQSRKLTNAKIGNAPLNSLGIFATRISPGNVFLLTQPTSKGRPGSAIHSLIEPS